MKKFIAIAISCLFAGISFQTLAGVAPSQGNSGLERSGYKAAPPKHNTEEKEEKKDHQEESKEQAK